MNERWLVATAMIQFGGGFVNHLGEALLRADSNNTERIHKAFPEYWQKYHKLAIEKKLGQMGWQP